MIRHVLISSCAMAVLAGSAFAADLPSRSAPPVFVPPPPIFTWTGVYVGGQIGYQWGTTSTAQFAPSGAYVTNLPSYSPSGVIGGAHIGYNYQIQQFVLGLEGDVDGSSYSGSASYAGPFPSNFTSYSTRIGIEGSVRGRIGYAWDRVLIYATGGAAFADIHNSYTSPPRTFGQIAVFTAPGGTDSFDQARVGWTVGGGVEYAIDPHWSVRAEYRYTDFGRYTNTLVNTYAGYTVQTHITDNAVRVGFSYKFDMYAPPASVVAKY